MKKIKILCILCVSLLLFNCDKDDDNDTSSNKSKLIGSWRYIKSTGTNNANNDMYEYIASCETEEKLTFTNDNVAIMIDNDCDGTTEEEGTYNYSINGSTIEIFGETAEIIELNDNSFIYETTYYEPEDEITYYDREYYVKIN
ncbi:lipocalin family protein [Flavobacterium sp.]|uniref:lipocalin family protein n=1 Tax=Flavobacterium sp. TaxID=239 RepID=UPI003527F9F4